MTQFHDLPQTKDFGYGFNYAVWSANTTVTLANVPWNSDYRDIVRFGNQSALDHYLDSNAGPVHVTTGVTYAAMGRPIQLEIPFNRANTFNYLRANNPAQPIGGDTPSAFYYFIQEVIYVTPDVTRFIIQLDVWQTFGYGATFGNCFIERGHIGVANQNQFSDNGREYLTIPEGLDIGGEYQIVDQWTHDIASARGNDNYSILVTSTVPLDLDPGTVEAPKLNSARGSSFENLPNGAESYLFGDLDHFKQFMAARSDMPWITQGIISITAIPDWSTTAGNYGINVTPATIAGTTVYKVGAGSLDTKETQLKNSWRDTFILGHEGRYQNLKKFLTYPYCVLEMTSYTGTPLVIKPESWSDAHATVVEVPHFAQPGPRIMFYPYRYNAAQPGPDPISDANGLVNDGGEFLDMATGIFNFPTFSLVNNGYMSFMASNAAGIAYQHQSADWSQQRALAGNELAASQATGAIGTSQQISRMGINAATQSTTLANETAGWSALQQGANAVVGSVGSGGGKAGALGAATSALSGVANAAASYAITTNQNNQSLGIANNLAAGTNAAQTGQAGYVRDTNKAYGDAVARGDYQNTIAGIDAKVQDARLIQPTTSGQVGGDGFLLSAYKWGYDIKVKMLQPAAMAVLGEFWLRYGYAVHRWGKMPASFMVCEKFTYWKLKETYITAANCPETFKQTLRGIFEKGVTVWANPADIGVIDIADNAPLDGVQL